MDAGRWACSTLASTVEVNHAVVTDVDPNDDFGLKLVEQARGHDIVYKLRH